MADVHDVAQKFRANLLAGEQDAASEMVRAYGRAFTSIEAEIVKVTSEIQNEVQAGKFGLVPPVAGGFSASQISPQAYTEALNAKKRQLEALRRQVLVQTQRFANEAALLTQASQSDAVQAALDEAPALLEAMADADPGGFTGTTFQRLDPDAVEDLVGFLQDGSPLQEVFNKLPPLTAGTVERALVDGITRGLNPRVVARNARAAGGIAASRALTIARTEQLRAYRTATLRTYAANGVEKWEWNCAKTPRTCAACFAMDGRTFDTSEEFMRAHPNCRCTPIPVSPYADPFAEGLPRGRDAFDNLTPEQQRRILGPKGYDAYSKGQVDLDDFVTHQASSKWGGMYRQASVKDALHSASVKAEASEAMKAAQLAAKKEHEKALAAARAKAYRDRKKAAAVTPEAPENPYPFDPDRLTPDHGEMSGMGGAHAKQVYRDENGKLWLFKPQDEFRAHADMATARLQKLTGLKAPDTHVITINGRKGSIQEILADKASRREPFKGGFDPTKMDPQGLAQMQRHHAFDWLIGNHDAHSGQYIRQAGSRELIGIDKGQAFKFFGNDRLDYDYNPNASFIGDDHVYNLMHKRYAQGHDVGMKLIHESADESKALREFVQQVRDIPDAEYKDILRPYAEMRSREVGLGQFRTVDEFLDAAVQRKNNLGGDLAKFHDRLEKERLEALKPQYSGKGKGMDAGRTFRTDSEGKAWARDHVGSERSTDEATALHNYQGSGYHDINAALRYNKGGEVTQPQWSGAVKNRIRNIEAAIDRNREFGEDVILWRGTDTVSLLKNDGARQLLSSRDDMRSLIGQTLVDDAFQSTSVGTSAAFNHKSIVLRIMAPSDTKGFYLDAISDIGEREVLLQRGYTMVIHDVKKLTGGYSSSGGRWQVDVEIIGSARTGRSAVEVGQKVGKRRPPKAPLKRQLKDWFADYKAGGLTLDEYQTKVNAMLDKTGYTLDDLAK